jgi:hypothetical protein
LKRRENIDPPFKWKLMNNIPLTKEDLIVKGNLDFKQSK